jgi:hypothetical protein
MKNIPLEVPTAEELPTFTRREREYIAHLNRRRAFLIDRIETSDVDLTWDKVELKALTWAISELSRSELVLDEHECAPGRCCAECDRHVTPHKGCVLR